MSGSAPRPKVVEKLRRRADFELTYEHGKRLVNPLFVAFVRETSEGIVVRGAKMLGTMAPITEEVAVVPFGGVPPGDDAYALAFAIPTNTPGLTFICRETVSPLPRSRFDHPLSSRFDENDATLQGIVDASGLACSEIDAALAAAVDAIGGVEDAIVRQVVERCDRSQSAGLDLRTIGRWRKQAMHYQLECRRPERIAIGQAMPVPLAADEDQEVARA